MKTVRPGAARGIRLDGGWGGRFASDGWCSFFIAAISFTVRRTRFIKSLRISFDVHCSHLVLAGVFIKGAFLEL